MKITIENKEYNLKANGKYMKKYHDLFKGNLIIDTYKAFEQNDLYIVAQLMYCAIEDIEINFEDWLDQFENPYFILPYKVDLQDFLLSGITPTVKYNGAEDDSKKKKINQ